MPSRAFISAGAVTALVLTVAGCGGHSRHSTSATHPAAAPAAAPRLTRKHPCPAARGFTCATLTVPLDHAGQGKGTLSLAVAVQNASSAPRGPLIFLAGGPGQPGVPFVRRVSRKLHAALAGYRLVMFDQRGTGAGALRCPRLQALAGDSDLINVPRSVTETCAREIGPSRRFYATAETVADIDELRAALGAPRVALDGVSYGTFVAERYALRYPNRVTALVLDSVVPQQGVDPLYAAALRGSGRVLRSVCAAQHCSFDPAAAVATLVRRRHIGPALLRSLVAESIVLPAFPGVLAALREALAGDMRQLRIFLADGGRSYGVTASELSQGLHESALCVELAPPWPSTASTATRAATLARLAAAVPAARLYPFDSATARGNGLVQGCLDWPPTPPPALPTGNISGPLPRVPVLLLAGEHDLSTPLEWAQQEAALVPDGHLLVVPGAGHSVQLRARDPDVRRTLARFLAGGS